VVNQSGNLTSLLFQNYTSQWAKSSKKQSEGMRFFLIRHSCYQKYTPTNSFFGDFAHWVISKFKLI